jgi:hypothetical protein
LVAKVIHMHDGGLSLVVVLLGVVSLDVDVEEGGSLRLCVVVKEHL